MVALGVPIARSRAERSRAFAMLLNTLRGALNMPSNRFSDGLCATGRELAMGGLLGFRGRPTVSARLGATSRRRRDATMPTLDVAVVEGRGDVFARSPARAFESRRSRRERRTTTTMAISTRR